MKCDVPIFCGASTCGVLGRCVNGTTEIGFRCECPRTYTPESRCAERDFSKICTDVGLTHDSVYCQRYYECTRDATGNLVATEKYCEIVGGMAHYFNKTTKVCYKVATNEGCIKEPF